MSTIEELYYGNITPSEREYRRGSEYAHVLQLATRSEEKLIGTLSIIKQGENSRQKICRLFFLSGH